jgi:hypothetical protein
MIVSLLVFGCASFSRENCGTVLLYYEKDRKILWAKEMRTLGLHIRGSMPDEDRPGYSDAKTFANKTVNSSQTCPVERPFQLWATALHYPRFYVAYNAIAFYLGVNKPFYINNMSIIHARNSAVAF